MTTNVYVNEKDPNTEDPSFNWILGTTYALPYRDKKFGELKNSYQGMGFQWNMNPFLFFQKALSGRFEHTKFSYGDKKYSVREIIDILKSCRSSSWIYNEKDKNIE